MLKPLRIARQVHEESVRGNIGAQSKRQRVEGPILTKSIGTQGRRVDEQQAAPPTDDLFEEVNDLVRCSPPVISYVQCGKQ